MEAALFFITVALLSYCSTVSSLGTGAPTFLNVCHDLTQVHSPFDPTVCAASDCPFSVVVDSIDGNEMQARQPSTFRCGSVYRLCVEASPGNQFRGFAVQSRNSTPELVTSDTNSDFQCGEFINFPTDTNRDVQEWPCPVQGVTHTNRNDKTRVCFDWVPPSTANLNSCTFWFSITRTFTNFHSQLKGLELQPDPAFCGTSTQCTLSCEGAFVADSNNQELEVNCTLVGCTTTGYTCQLDQQISERCTIPQTISLVGLSIGNHEFTVNAPISDSSQIPQATIRFPNNPTLVCTTSTENTQLSITCASNFNTTEGTCTCLLDNNPFEPCNPYDGIDIDRSTVGVGPHTFEIRCTHITTGIDAPVNTFTITGVTPLSLECTTEFNPETQEICVTCTSSRNLASLDFECSLNALSVTDGCGQFPFCVSIVGLSGLQTIVIGATDSADGASVRSTITADIGTPATSPPPTTPPPVFRLTCGFSGISPAGPVNVDCSVTGGDVESVVCSYDDGAIVEDCSLDFALGFDRFAPGDHSLTITVTSTSGASVSTSSNFTVPPAFQIVCLESGVPGRITFNCDSDNELFGLPSCTVTPDSGVAVTVPCVFGEDFTVGLPNFVPGAYSLSVSATDVFEQSASVERSFTIIEPLTPPPTTTTPPPAVPLNCFELADSVGSESIQLLCSDNVLSANCLFDDGTSPIVPCDIRNIIIDTFTVTPGPRVLIINYIDENGNAGVFEYSFTGRVRPRAAIGFAVADLGVIRESESLFFGLSDSGFSYGDIPVVVTPQPCSDYPGDLSALFSDIPTASASLDDLVNSTARTVILVPVNRFFSRPQPELILFSAVPDDLDEGRECLVFTLSINETQLDPRDQGQVDLSTSVALVRILDEVIVTTPPPIPVCDISCFPLLGSRLLSVSCQVLGGGALTSSVCDYDDDRLSENCDISPLVINQFTFSPGPHTVNITYTCDNGASGLESIDFDGEIRQRILISYAGGVPPDNNITEAGVAALNVIATGFSFGNIPITVTPRSCSDYEGNLEDIFNNVPASSSNPAEDLVNSEPITVNIDLAFFPTFGSAEFTVAFDDQSEGQECLIVELSVDETQLDPRDQGQVDFSNGVALFRIDDLIDPRLLCSSSQALASISVDCDSNFNVDEVTCSFDGATPEPCTLPLIIDQLQYAVGPHTLVITASSQSFFSSATITFNGLDIDSLPSLIVNFNVAGTPTDRVLETRESEQPSYLEVSVNGDSFGPLPFIVRYLTYEEFQEATDRDLDKIFPSIYRPAPASSDSDFTTAEETGTIPAVFRPDIANDTEVELTEGFVAYLEIDDLVDPRDLERIQFLNDIVLVTIEGAIECSSSVTDDVATVSCGDIDGQPDILCSIDSGDIKSCNFPYRFSVSQLSTGGHQVRIYRQEAGQLTFIGGATVVVEPLDVYFVGNTPELTVNTLVARFRANRPNITFICHLTHLDTSREDCSSGVFERSGIPHGDYTLRVIARDPARPSERRTVIRNRIWVHGDDVFCVTGTQNRALTVNGNNATVEFYSTGVVTGFTCVVDRSEIIENCVSPYTVEGLTLGRHHFKVIPLGCGREYRPNTMQFNIC